MWYLQRSFLAIAIPDAANSRLLSEGEALPQLVVIDGGKGQLSAALKSFDVLGIRGKVAILGIAKRLEELYFPCCFCGAWSSKLVTDDVMPSI